MSVIKHKEQRVGVFIDAQNLYHSAKNLHHGRVNFDNVLQDALAGRQLVRAIAYVITTESGEESGFFDALNKIGIETKTKDLQIFSSGSKKADWDVGLAIDAVKLCAKLDVVVLASGDGDFIPLVEFLKMNGCQVEVITFGKSASGKLKEVADDFVDLDTDPGRYVMGGNRFAGRQERQERPERAERVERPEHEARPERQERQPRHEKQHPRDDGKIGGMRKVIRKLR
jgi:uncharacterized LabA/DUF88 family protein